jgi:hypothetical protein
LASPTKVMPSSKHAVHGKAEPPLNHDAVADNDDYKAALLSFHPAPNTVSPVLIAIFVRILIMRANVCKEPISTTTTVVSSP